MKDLVIDASVVLKWYLTDEEWGQEAISILERYVAGELTLFAPPILLYEVSSALIVAERRGRIAQETTQNALQGFFDLGITFCDPFVDVSNVLFFSRSFHRSVYDASYLAVAAGQGIEFLTGDKRLYHAVKDDLKWVKWIGEGDQGLGVGG